MKKGNNSTGGRFCLQKMLMASIEMSVKRLNDDIETVDGFCYLGKALNASGGSEMTAVARTRIG